MHKAKPNFTQIPNFILDNMSELTLAEFRIICVISRQTYGWQKDSDRISISQFMEKSGLSNRSIIDSIRSLEKKGWVEITITKFGKEYSILDSSEPSSQVNGEVVNLVHRGSEPSSQVASEPSSHTKETNINKLYKINKLVIDQFNKITNSKITLTERRGKNIQKTISEHSLKKLIYSIHNISRDSWSIENKQVRIERLIERDKRDSNIDKFGHFPFRKRVVKKTDPKFLNHLAETRRLRNA